MLHASRINGDLQLDQSLPPGITNWLLTVKMAHNYLLVNRPDYEIHISPLNSSGKEF